MKAINWNESDEGMTFNTKIFLPNCKTKPKRFVEMIEAAAEANEELMEKYLEEGELTIDEIKEGLRSHTE